MSFTKDDVRLSWPQFLALAGGSFTANLVALLTAISITLAPLKKDVADNTKSIDVIHERVDHHVAAVSHPGMAEVLDQFRIEVRKDLSRIESKLTQLGKDL